MAVDSSQSTMTTLSDNTVSRMMAEKAFHDERYKELLLEYMSLPISAGPLRAKDKKFEVILKSIRDFRQQIADNAKLEAPRDSFGRRRDLSTYLKQVLQNRVLVPHHRGDRAKKEGGSEVTSKVVNNEWRWVGYPQCVARLASCFLQSTLRFQADPSPFPFERLPPELRLQVYREALKGPMRNGVTCGERILVFYNRSKNFQYKFAKQQKGESKDMSVSLLATNRLVNHEAVPVLYQMHTFDFATNIRSIVPFLLNLSDDTRQNLRGIWMELHDSQEPDHCCGGIGSSWVSGSDNQAAWLKACSFMAKNVKMEELNLTINVKISKGFKSLLWVKALTKIKGLRRLTLEAKQHHDDEVPVRASYEEGSLAASRACFSEHLIQLFEYLREKMLEQHSQVL